MKGAAMNETLLSEEAEAPSKGPFRLALGLIALAASTFLTVLSIAVLIPDQTDYAEVSNLKHQRLASLEGPKIVLVGGSNLAYGIESDVIEHETGCQVANMGMNGWFGVRFMLAEVKPDLNSGDIVVIAFEWDNYGKSADGSGKDLLAVSKANPSVLNHFTPKQLGMAAQNLPFVAQSKVRRVSWDTISAIGSVIIDNEPETDIVAEVESLGNFDAQGDLHGHEGVEFDRPVDLDGDDLTVSGLYLTNIELIKAFAREMSARGVTVIMSFTPTAQPYYDEQHEMINRAHDLLTSGKDAVTAPRPPGAYVFDPSYFFDTLYHLKTTKRGERSKMVADDIKTVLGNTSICEPMNS